MLSKIKIVDGFKELDSDIHNQLTESLPIIQVIDFLAESAEKILKSVDDTEDQVLESDFTNETNQYLLQNNAEIIKILTIKLCSKVRPRFSCSAHKTNIAVKNAIQRNKRISKILSTLSRFAAENRNTIALAKIFEANKARLLYENLTRWNSSYLMMVSFLRAYDKQVFTDEYKCPIERKTIELYIQILKPIHDMSIHFQRSNSDISDVFPTILLLIIHLMRLDLDHEPSAHNFVVILIEELKHKFEFELKSKVYLAAAFLNYPLLNEWSTRSFGQEHFKRAPNIIFHVNQSFNQTNDQQNDKQNSKQTVKVDQKKENNPFYSLLSRTKSISPLSKRNRSFEYTKKYSVCLVILREKFLKKNLVCPNFFVKFKNRTCYFNINPRFPL